MQADGQEWLRGADLRALRREAVNRCAAASLSLTLAMTVTRQNLPHIWAGIEFGLVENLSAKVEYDFYDFGSKNYNFAAITPVSVRSNLHTLTAGLNYKFNWPSGGPKP